jgi:hypothetical protein
LNVLSLGADSHVSGFGSAAQPNFTIMQNRGSRRNRAEPEFGTDLVWGEHPGAITLVGHRYSAVTVATDGAHPDVTGRRTQQPVAPPDDVGIA